MRTTMPIPNLVAHRGLMETYPENTLVGLEAALQCGASYIEFDVQCSADGTLIVLHDDTLQRTCGVNGNVFEMSWEELQNIRAHEPARFSLAFFNQRIPSLADVVRLLQRYPRATAFVEIKEECIERFGTNQIMSALLSELEIIHQQCVVISFHAGAIKYVRDHSDFLCGWVLHHYDSPSQQHALELAPDYLIVNHRKLPANEEPWPGQWHWMIYDITVAELALHYASFNIPLIESRDVCALLEHPVLALNHMQHA